MPELQNAIDGAVRPEPEPQNGNSHRIEYYQGNGFASFANCAGRKRANGKLFVEYRNYDKVKDLCIGDEYMPLIASLKQQVMHAYMHGDADCKHRAVVA